MSDRRLRRSDVIARENREKRVTRISRQRLRGLIEEAVENIINEGYAVYEGVESPDSIFYTVEAIDDITGDQVFDYSFGKKFNTLDKAVVSAKETATSYADAESLILVYVVAKNSRGFKRDRYCVSNKDRKTTAKHTSNDVIMGIDEYYPFVNESKLQRNESKIYEY